MATISRTGISNGGLITPAHITNIIDALDGTGVGITVVATGSFTGSLVGNATTATTASYVLQAVSASFATSASYAVSSSRSLTSLSSSFATSASYAPGSAATFPYTGSARISGSLQVTGSTSILGNVDISGSSATGISMYTNKLDGNLLATNNLIFNLSQLGRTAGTGKFTIPVNSPAGVPPAGTMYWDDTNATLFIYSEVNVGWASMPFNI